MWPFFSRSIEHDQGQEVFYKGIQGILTSIEQAIISLGS